MTNHEKIIELNTIWYDFICGEHHKDKDCHFRISTHYHYGDKVEYEVDHYGYIMDEVHEEFDTLEEAENYLINKVFKKGILEEIDWYLNLPKPETMGCYDEHPKYDKKDLESLRQAVLEIAS